MTESRVTWSNHKVVLTLFWVFLAGAAMGALVTKLYLQRATVKAAAILKAESKKDLLQRMKRELNLTPDQTDRIGAIVEDYTKMMHDLQVQLSDVRDHGKAQILQVLTPEQRLKYDEMLKK